ncbi:MAG TPA: HAD family hydrolase [Chitinophagaceae bacterium]|nr:HAD family hydrolase [Chitinophagaceae bacterium]
MKQIAFFDFDGTITTKDTLLEFIKFSKGLSHFYAGFLLYSPFLVAYKLKLISNQAAKEKVLSFFYKGVSVADFEKKCRAFATEYLPALVRPKALAEIRKLQEMGIQVVIVSASPENWIRPWSATIGAELIATRLVVKDDQLTGQIYEKNCYGNEKVARITSHYVLTGYDKIYAYGDSSGDKPMLKLATISFYKPFR